MDGENSGKTLLKWDDLGGKTLFSEKPHMATSAALKVASVGR